MAVKVLKLDPADADLPKIETIKVEDVIAAVVKTKGDVVMGFVVQESATEVTIRNQTGAEQKLAVEEIQERQKLPTSLMPPGLMESADGEGFCESAGLSGGAGEGAEAVRGRLWLPFTTAASRHTVEIGNRRR